MRLVGLLAAALLFAGCGTTSAPSTRLPIGSSAVALPPSAATADVPTHLTFAAIGVDAGLESTGLNPNGTIAVPPLDQAAQVDYLHWSPAFGAGRPLVVVSHVSGRSPAGHVIPGGFLRLSAAKVGDQATVTSTSGAAVTYRVTDVRTVPKDAFPSDIYRVRAVPTLVAITCGGVLDRAARSFLSNVVVEAVAV